MQFIVKLAESNAVLSTSGLIVNYWCYVHVFIDWIDWQSL